MDYTIIFNFITSFLVTFIALPVYIKVAIYKRLFDEPNESRKVHGRVVPSMGGLVIFASTMFSFFLFYPLENIYLVQYLMPCIILLLFVGIKDDVIGTSAIYKLLANIIVALIMVVATNTRLTGFHGLFGIREIPEYLSVLLSVFTYIVIINSINLIDGIDGLATGISLNASFWFGVWFFMAGNTLLSGLAFSLTGALAAFLIFNFQPARIFMGDTGSLFIGFLLATLSIQLIEYDKDILPPSLAEISKPILGMAMLSYPLFDTLRVFILRLARGVSPFTADKNHLHHKWLDLGFSHAKTSIILIFSNAMVVIVSYLCHIFHDSFITFGCALLFSIVIYLLPLLLMKLKKKEKNAA